jgi:hypothetical protein
MRETSIEGERKVLYVKGLIGTLFPLGYAPPAGLTLRHSPVT